jgi:Ala-tRNA(Pro) deacylase
MKTSDYLKQQHVSFELLQHGTTYTAQELAAMEHVPGRNVAKPVLVRADDKFVRNVAKPVLVRADDKFVLCVLPAPSMVDLKRVADAMGAEAAELASETELASVFDDCELGAEPPFGHLYGIDTLMDSSLCKDDYLVFQAGSHTEAVKINRSDYERLAAPQVASFARLVS